MRRDPKGKEYVAEDSERVRLPNPFSVIADDISSVFRIEVDYSQLSDMQGMSIQSILVYFRDNNRCYIPDSERLDYGERVVSLAFNESRAAVGFNLRRLLAWFRRFF